MLDGAFYVPAAIISVGIACAAVNLLLERVAVRIYRRRYRRFQNECDEHKTARVPPKVVTDEDDGHELPRDDVVIVAVDPMQLQASSDESLEADLHSAQQEDKSKNSCPAKKMLLPDVPIEANQICTNVASVCSPGVGDDIRQSGVSARTPPRSPLGKQSIVIEVVEESPELERRGLSDLEQVVEQNCRNVETIAFTCQPASSRCGADGEEQGTLSISGAGRVAVMRLPQPPAVSDDFVSSG